MALERHETPENATPTTENALKYLITGKPFPRKRAGNVGRGAGAVGRRRVAWHFRGVAGGDRAAPPDNRLRGIDRGTILRLSASDDSLSDTTQVNRDRSVALTDRHPALLGCGAETGSGCQSRAATPATPFRGSTDRSAALDLTALDDFRDDAASCSSDYSLALTGPCRTLLASGAEAGGGSKRRAPPLTPDEMIPRL